MISDADMKQTIEDTKRIDIRYMRKQGLLKPGMMGQLLWTFRGQPNGDIRYLTHKDHLAINYCYRAAGGPDWEPVSQVIRFDYTTCHFGGQRTWFLCPACSRRVAVLCGAGKLFLCRHCHQLPYESQLLDDLCRMIEQKHKLGRRIFEYYEYGEGWGKAKGLHWKTYERLYQRYSELEDQCQQGIYERFNHLPDSLSLSALQH